MSTISNGSVTLHVEDTGGDGRPVVLVHGWPLSGASWSDQVPALTDAGYRVVTYDRRGFGESDKPGDASGYDYDTLTSDLDAVMTGLDLRDVTLVGFSMGGGEVARYLGAHGSDRVHSAVFAAAIPPCLALDDDHPDGALDDDTVAGYQAALEADPRRLPRRLHPQLLQRERRAEGHRGAATGGTRPRPAGRRARRARVHPVVDHRLHAATWPTVTVPTLVIHGDSDAIVPFEKSGQRTHEQVAGSELHVVEGGPHGINTSHTAGVQPRAARVPRALTTAPVTTPQSGVRAGSGLRLGCRGPAVDAGLLALLGRDRRRGVGQRVVAAAGLRERDDVADRLVAAEQHDDAVPAERDAAVRRGAELERVEQEAELLLRLLRRTGP